MSKLKHIITFASLFLFLWSCENEKASPIPNVPVDLRLNLTAVYPTFRNSINDTLVFDPHDDIFNEQPGYGIFAIGYAGILLYSDLEGKYQAFDLCCPYEIDPRVRVFPNESGEAICRKCGSKFILYYGGAVSQGPSKYPLKKYPANLTNTTGGEYLIVQN